MSTWMYQISPKLWSPQRYRLEIWENERWSWPVGSMSGKGRVPEAGDIVVFFYSPSGGDDPGFYGWAVVLEWYEDSSTPLTFRPTSPSDFLKMYPWWDNEAEELADLIRGKMKQRTLWMVPGNLIPRLRKGVAKWLADRK